MKKFLSVISLVLIFVLLLSGCGKREMKIFDNISRQNAEVIGKGESAFYLNVDFGNGQQTVYEVHTDEKTVGESLVALSLIEGEKGPYGLYVKKVAGVEADFDKNGKYWAFYIDGEYATKGVDEVEIEGEKTYTFKVE